MSKTALTILLVIAGIIAVGLILMFTMGRGMMGGMMGGMSGMGGMGGMMCPMCIIGLVGGLLVVGLLVWLIINLTRRTGH